MAEATLGRLTNDVADRGITTTGALAAASGVAASLSPASPTGYAVADGVMVAATVAVVTVGGALLPWWLVIAAAGVALAAAFGLGPTVIAVAALMAGCWAATQPARNPYLAVVSVGLTMNALAWARLEWFFGASSIIGIGVGAMLVVVTISRLGRRPRRIAVLALIGLGAIAGLGTAGFAMTALHAREDLADGKRASERAIRYLNEGDFDAAQEQFERAATLLGRAEEALDGPLGTAAQWVPVVAQHRDTSLTISHSSASATETAAAALDAIDADRLRIDRSRIDLAAITELQTPFHDLTDAIGELRETVESSRSPWLIEPLDTALDELVVRIDDNRPRLDNAVATVDLAPQLLGEDGPRVYLVLFTTPAEARGLGGFVGNYAELTVDGGHFEMTEFGRVHDLEQALAAASARISQPPGFLDRYGGFGYDVDGDGLLGTAPWRNLTIAPHFPWVSNVAAQMYAQVTGTDIDGVIAMDPYTLQELIRYTGPIHLPSLDRQIDQKNAAHFLLRGQYEATTDKDERVDALGEAAESTMDRLLDGHLPKPAEIARDLGPLAQERRLMMWSADTDERDLLAEVGLLGEIPGLEGTDGWSVAVTNAAGSKIDSFLERTATYEATTDPDTGITTGTIRVDLKNGAPRDGLPDYIIGNSVGLPSGTSRLYVAVYSALPLAQGRVDGDAHHFDVERELGWNVYDTYVTIPPGGTTTIEVTLEGQVADPDQVVTWEQPLVR